MLEFFGGKPSVVADARVERTDVVSGMRGTGLNAPSVERSINENNENVSSETPASESLSESTVTGTLDITFKRRKDVRRDDVANTNIVSEPGPEYVGDQQCLDGGVSAVQQSGSDAEHEEIETMTISSSGKASSEWGEANENVLESRSNGSSQRSSRASRHHFDNGEPGPEHYGDDSAATIDDGGAYVRGQVHENGESVLEQPGAHNGHAASAANGQAGGMPVAAQAPILIRGAQVVNDDSIFNADVLIEDKVIKQVLHSLSYLRMPYDSHKYFVSCLEEIGSLVGNTALWKGWLNFYTEVQLVLRKVYTMKSGVTVCVCVVRAVRGGGAVGGRESSDA